MTIQLEIGDDLEHSLEQYAVLFGASKEQYIQEAIIEKLDDLEDLWIAQERLQTSSKRYSMQEVEQEIDLAN